MTEPIDARSPIRSVAVIRALPGLGDCLCLVPALRSVRAGAPGAAITVVGHPNGRWMPGRFPELVDRWIDLPHWPSIIECSGTPPQTAELLAHLRSDEPPFDMALQLHGSGGPINWLGVALRARAVVVHTTPNRLGPWTLARPWPDCGHELDRLADLAEYAGFPPVKRALEFPVLVADRAAAAATVPRGPYAVVHPGASRADRRWPACGFGAVARHLVASGRHVVVTAGRPDEREVARAVMTACGRPERCLLAAGLSLGVLGALLAGADAVVANDTGVAHLAVAVGTRTVVVGTTSDLDRWGPRDRFRHRAVQTTGGADDVTRIARALDEVLAPRLVADG